ncbi:histidine phosphatase family protein [Curvivirga sp.]|uniref:histidine phosphatase family protein n=1 Tax=Curvivirga sp. TaxID=2856848 RepID=UPI003B5BF395
MRDNLLCLEGKYDFLFVRHGETDWNLQGRIQGHTDIELNETGLQQAYDAANLLAQVDISYIVTSPLVRAKKTAEIIRLTHDVPFYEEDDLREAMFGAAQGQARQGWAADWRAGEYCPEGAESFLQFQQRVIRGLGVSLAHSSQNQKGLPLIVAHGGVYWAICHALDIGGELDIPNATPVRLYTKQGKWHMKPLMEWANVVGGMM